jgi:hypothetical protein
MAQANLEDRLGTVLQKPDAVLLVGSGLFLWSGLPSWAGLLTDLATFVEKKGREVSHIAKRSATAISCSPLASARP